MNESKKHSKLFILAMNLLLFIFSNLLFSCNEKESIPKEPAESTQKKNPYCGVNYYPKNHAWHMWEQAGWDSEIIPNEISEELKVAKTLGVDITRIFINYKSFGKNNPSLNINQVTYLQRYLEITKDLNINVIITLFDDCLFQGSKVVNDDGVVSSPNAIDHVLKMAELFKEYKNIIAWDLINEPDGHRGFFDFNKGQWHTIGLNWLVDIFDALNDDLNKRNSTQRITLGSIMGASIMTRVADRFPGIIPQMHQYSPYVNSSDFYNKVKEGILELYYSFKGPVFIGEFGYSAPLENGQAIERQAAIYQTLLRAIDDNKEKVHSVTNWTLYDFPKAHGDEMYFGIITKDDVLKPSANIIKQFYKKWQE